jgi:hypothetical protein
MNNFILEKRTAEAIYFQIDCSNLLEVDELITQITSVTSDQDGLSLSQFAFNDSTVIFPDNTTAEAGKVISLEIADGIIQPTQTSQLYTIRAIFTTSLYNTREATVLLKVTNIPIQTGRSC